MQVLQVVIVSNTSISVYRKVDKVLVPSISRTPKRYKSQTSFQEVCIDLEKKKSNFDADVKANTKIYSKAIYP